MKYILALIAVALTVGIYFWTRPRPVYSACGAYIATTNECLEGVTIK